MMKNRKVGLAMLVVGLLLIVFSVYHYQKNRSEVSNQDLGSCKTPEEAFKETQKALNLISESLNSGMENASVIGEYETAKNKVFKK